MIKSDYLSHIASLISFQRKTVNRRRTNGHFDLDEGSDIKDESEVIQENDKLQSIRGVRHLLLINKRSLNESAHQTILYGEQLLDGLRNLQQSLLEGIASYEDLKKLADSLHSIPSHFTEESMQLKNIVSDIQVRVAVELAKYNKNKE
jgi:hypothetical protein